MFDAHGNVTRAWQSYWQGQSQAVSDTDNSVSVSGAAVPLRRGNATQSTAELKGDHLSVKMFGAVGDDIADDTAAVQSALTYGSLNRVAVYFPPGVYKITGAGLAIITGNPGIYGLMSIGTGAPVLKYYGTGTCLTIGDITNRIFAVNLVNITIVIASGYAAQYGIDVRNFSGGEWPGVAVVCQGTGKCAACIRFSDASGINLYRFTLNYPAYTAGSVGLLFDDFVSFGNSNIVIDVTDIANLEVAWDIRNLQTSWIKHHYVENCKIGVRCDNTSHTTQINQVVFDSGEFNTSGTGAPSHIVLSYTAAAGKGYECESLRFTNSRFFLSGGITNPFRISINSAALSYPTSRFSLIIDHNMMIGANGSIVDVANSGNLICNLRFGPNYAYDNTGLISASRVSSTSIATVIDDSPSDASSQPINWRDPSGAQNVAGSSGNTMTRPAAGYYGPGVITGVSQGDYYNDDGFLRLLAGGGVPFPPATTGSVPSQSVYIDLSGFSNVSDMSRNIVFFIAGTEILRIDAGQVKISNAPLTSASGTLQVTGNLAATGYLFATGNVYGASTDMASLLAITVNLQAQINALSAGKANAGSYTTSGPSAGAAHTHSVSI